MIGSIFDHTVPPPGSVGAGTVVPSNCGMEFTCSIGGCNLVGVAFWKVATDTGSHVAQVYRVSDQALLGSVTFSGETASGWQTANLGTPIPLTANTPYRMAISRNVAWAYMNIGSGFSSGVLSAPSSDYYTLSLSGFPGSSNGFHTFVTDVLVDGVPPTQARVSQVAAEAWEANLVPKLYASQIATEVWENGLVPRELISQVTAETWIRNGTFLITSQALAEVWVEVPPQPTARRLNIASQVVAG
jgi:hypothetical protein